MDKYRIVEKLSGGSGGTVFKIVRISDRQELVLKRISLIDLDPRARSQAKLEVDLMQQLHHPHIVPYHDAFLFNDEDLCIVMEYLSGGDLGHIVDRSHKNPPLTERRVMLWFAQVALALHYLHSHQIVHRDLKTQNVFLNSKTGQVMIGDFGVASILETARPSGETPSGTPLYMAPEVLQGNRCTYKSDVWSLGCIMYELLCSRHPFEAHDIATLVIKVVRGSYPPLPAHYSRDLARLVDSMLERDPLRRPLIDEVLQTPYVAHYLHLYLSTRVPVGPPDHPSEVVLAQQIEALGIVVGEQLDRPTELLTTFTARHHMGPSPPPARKGSLERTSERGEGGACGDHRFLGPLLGAATPNHVLPLDDNTNSGGVPSWYDDPSTATMMGIGAKGGGGRITPHEAFDVYSYEHQAAIFAAEEEEAERRRRLQLQRPPLLPAPHRLQPQPRSTFFVGEVTPQQQAQQPLPPLDARGADDGWSPTPSSSAAAQSSPSAGVAPKAGRRSKDRQGVVGGSSAAEMSPAERTAALYAACRGRDDAFLRTRQQKNQALYGQHRSTREVVEGTLAHASVSPQRSNALLGRTGGGGRVTATTATTTAATLSEGALRLAAAVAESEANHSGDNALAALTREQRMAPLPAAAAYVQQRPQRIGGGSGVAGTNNKLGGEGMPFQPLLLRGDPGNPLFSNTNNSNEQRQRENNNHWLHGPPQHNANAAAAVSTTGEEAQRRGRQHGAPLPAGGFPRAAGPPTTPLSFFALAAAGEMHQQQQQQLFHHQEHQQRPRQPPEYAPVAAHSRTGGYGVLQPLPQDNFGGSAGAGGPSAAAAFNMASPGAKKLNDLDAELRRRGQRRRLIGLCVNALGEEVFTRVYGYCARHRFVGARDEGTLKRLVDNAAAMHAVRRVDELLELERSMGLG